MIELRQKNDVSELEQLLGQALDYSYVFGLAIYC